MTPTWRASPAPATWPRGRGCAPASARARASCQGGTTRKGSKWLRRALSEAAHGVARTKQAGRAGLARRDRRLVVRRGKKKAAVAVGHHLLTIAYHVLHRQEDYHESVLTNFDERRRARTRDRAVDQLRQLGFEVTRTAKEAVA